MSDKIPCVEVYRRIGLHAFQDDDRIEERVKPAIDAVHATNDIQRLYEHAISFRNPAESRLFAAAKIRAMFELRAASHESRQGIDMEMLSARTVGLDSLAWAELHHYFGGLCDATARAPGVQQTIEKRPEHHVRRMKEAIERAREWRNQHRRPVAVEG